MQKRRLSDRRAALLVSGGDGGERVSPITTCGLYLPAAAFRCFRRPDIVIDGTFPCLGAVAFGSPRMSEAMRRANKQTVAVRAAAHMNLEPLDDSPDR